MDWPDFISKVGFPAAFAVMLAFAVWRVARWGKPYAERAVEGHINLVTALNDRDRIQTERLGAIDNRLGTIETEITRTREMATSHMSACELVHKHKGAI